MIRGVPLALDVQCRVLGLPVPIAEHQFFHGRKWRFDWAWPAQMLALEVEGGAWTKGRHTRGAGFIADMEKYNHAAVAGWRLLRVTPQQVTSGVAVDYVQRCLRPYI